MKKKVLSLLLAVSLVSVSVSPALAAEFSDGGSSVVSDIEEGDSAENELSVSENENTDAADSSAEIGNSSLFSTDSAGSLSSPDSAAAAEDSFFSDQLIPDVSDYSDLQAAGSVRDDTVSSSNTYNITVEGTLIRSEAAEFVRLVNEARAERGVKPLVLDQKMQDVSDQRAIHASVMYSHHLPGAGSSKLWNGECICQSGSGKGAFNIWKRSPSHWSGLMASRYESIGFSIFYNNGAYYAAADLYDKYQGTYPENLEDETDSFSFNIEKDYINDNHIKQTYSMSKNTNLKLSIKENNKEGDTVFNITSVNGVWESSNPKIATVDNDGNVTAVSLGTATIRYYVNGNRDHSLDTTINVVSVKTPEIQVKVEKNSPTIGLKWNLTKDILNNENSMGYQIFVYDSAVGEYTLYNEVGLDLEDFDEEYFTGMTVGYGTTKKVKIRLYMNQNDGEKTFGEFSNEVTFSTTPSYPEMESVTMKNKKAYLKWTESENADGYAIFRRIGKKGSYKRIKTINSGDVVKYTNSKLTYGKKYCYKVKAFYVTPEGKKVYTSYSNTKSKTCR